MKISLPLVLVLCLPAFGAPVAAYTPAGDKVEITLPAGHTAAWVTWLGGSYTLPGSAADTDGDGRIIVDGDDFGITWIIADVQTGEWSRGSSNSTNVTASPLPAGTLLPGPGGAYSTMVVSAKFLGGSALWLRPGVGAWGPVSTNLLAFPSGVFNFVTPDATNRWAGLGASGAPPASFRRGDVLLLLSRWDALTGTVDAQLDAAPNPGVISFDQTGIQFDEGKNMFFDIVRTGGTAGTVTVRCCNFAGSAVPGVDYTPPPVTDLVFQPGEYYKHVVFPVLNDEAYTQSAREVRITPVSVAGAPLAGLVETVLSIRENDPRPTVAFGDVAASYPETDTPWKLQVPVRLTGAIRGTFRTQLEASSPRMTATQIPVVFQEGETLKTVEVPIPADDVTSATYALTLRLDGNSSRSVTIVDDDLSRMKVESAVTVREDGNAVALNISIEPAVASDVTFVVSTADGTAKALQDYESIVNRQVTTRGSTAVSVHILDDRIVEGPETFYVDIKSISGPVKPPEVTRIAVTIEDVDGFLTMLDTTVSEQTGVSSTAKFHLDFSPPAPLPGTFHYQTVDGTAKAGSDYAAISGTKSFAAGTDSVDLEVEVFGDAVSEPAETFSLKIDGQPQWLTLTRGESAEATIYDDDSPAAQYRFRISDVTVREADDWTEAAFTVSLSPAAPTPLHVSWATADGTAVAPLDYESASGVLTFAPGQTSQTVKVRVAGDALSEKLETFAVVLSGANALIEDGRGICAIEDDDVLPSKRRSARH